MAQRFKHTQKCMISIPNLYRLRTKLGLTLWMYNTLSKYYDLSIETKEIFKEIVR